MSLDGGIERRKTPESVGTYLPVPEQFKEALLAGGTVDLGARTLMFANEVGKVTNVKFEDGETHVVEIVELVPEEQTEEEKITMAPVTQFSRVVIRRKSGGLS